MNLPAINDTHVFGLNTLMGAPPYQEFIHLSYPLHDFLYMVKTNILKCLFDQALSSIYGCNMIWTCQMHLQKWMRNSCIDVHNMVMYFVVLSPFLVMVVFLWEDWMNGVQERKWWIIDLMWYCIYDSNGLNLWVLIYGVSVPMRGFRYNEIMLT